MLIDQSIKRVRAYRQSQGWSVLRLAKAAGLNESTIRYMDHADWCPTADTLRKLESAIPGDFDQSPTPAPAPRAQETAA